MEKFISKSQKKNYADYVQNVGISLKLLSLQALEIIPLSDALRNALLHARKMKSGEGARRQAQLIGKLMRCADLNGIFEVCDELYSQGKINPSHYKDLAQWRDKLKTMPAPPLKDPARTRRVRELYPVESPTPKIEKHTPRPRAWVIAGS